jgi:hypothetical protein
MSHELLSGQVNLDSYPFRLVSLIEPGFRYSIMGATQAYAPMDRLLSAVELLEDRGWELINVSFMAQGETMDTAVAFLRRHAS